MRGSSFATAGSDSRIGMARKLRKRCNPSWATGLTSREKPILNGIYLDEIQAPKPEFRDQAQQGTQALAHPRTRRSIAGGLAAGFAPPVRSRAGLRAGKSDQRTVLLRVSGQQSCFEVELSGGDSGLGAGRQFLFL